MVNERPSGMVHEHCTKQTENNRNAYIQSQKVNPLRLSNKRRNSLSSFLPLSLSLPPFRSHFKSKLYVMHIPLLNFTLLAAFNSKRLKS